MTERQLIAYAILFLVLIGAVLLLWRRSRRTRRAHDPHLRIDLLSGEAGDTLRTKR